MQDPGGSRVLEWGGVSMPRYNRKSTRWTSFEPGVPVCPHRVRRPALCRLSATMLALSYYARLKGPMLTHIAHDVFALRPYQFVRGLPAPVLQDLRWVSDFSALPLLRSGYKRKDALAEVSSRASPRPLIPSNSVYNGHPLSIARPVEQRSTKISAEPGDLDEHKN